MIKNSFEVENETIITLMPEGIAAQYQVIWLIAPEGDSARAWLENTSVCEYAETSKAMLMCLPGGKADDFYSEKVWDELFKQYPDVNNAKMARRLIGLGDGAVTALNLVFTRPEKFFVAVAVCPTWSGKTDVISNAGKYRESSEEIPRLVISDNAAGKGRELGDAINEFGFGMHVYSDRECFGWALAGQEVESCLAHLK